MKNQKLLNTKLADMYTRIFLKSKHVVMVSEIDFLSRIKICVKATYKLPFFLFWIGIFLYYKFAIISDSKEFLVMNPGYEWVIRDENIILNTYIILTMLHFMMAFFALVVMLNLTMGKGTTAVTIIFNVLYLTESMLYASLIFIFDAVGLLRKFKNPSEFLIIIQNQWVWIFMYILFLISFHNLKPIFYAINEWNREWIRISRYRKTQDKENAFVFKTWVTKEEINARKAMISTGWLLILFTSFMDLFDIFFSPSFGAIKYTLLALGYVIYIASFVIPFNYISAFFYWGFTAILFSVFTYGLWEIQNEAWKPGNWYLYTYFFLMIPFLVSLSHSIKYTWTLRNRTDIKAIVVKEFNSLTDFEEFTDVYGNQDMDSGVL